jgi:hypothetical protein
VGGEVDDEVGVEGGGDPVEQGDGRDDAACLEAGQGGLGHCGAGGEFDLGEPQGQAAFADGLADQEGSLCLGVSLAVSGAVAALAGQVLRNVVSKTTTCPGASQ